MAKKQETTVFDDLIAKAPKITVLSDNPVSLADMKSDTFNLRYHLGPIYDIIRHEDTQMPLTIGINGKWGTGKTTAMQWLYDALERWNLLDESKGKVKTRNVRFYPWKYHNKEDVWKGLITEVILNVTDFENASTATILKAVKLLSAFAGESVLDILSDSEFEVAGFKVKPKVFKKIKKNFQKANHPEQSYLNEYEDAFKNWIKDALSKTNERMVIFIDDLDRCMPDIALQVLEALKLYLRIDNLIFVIGMDKIVVKKAVSAYYIDKHIEDIDADGYLDKMLQVELQLSPLQKEMEIYLDEQLKVVGYEQKLEYKDEEGNKKFYGLFKKLISKYSVRNPRQINRLINSSLIRGAGAERIEKETDNHGLAFEQGVQIFFIQEILAKKWGRTELVGDGGVGDSFFAEWSKIVREHDGKKGFSCTVSKKTIYKFLPENMKEESDVIPSHNEKLATSMTETISQFYISILDDPGYSDLLILLPDKELGQLMRIEYSITIADFSKQQDSDLLSSNDDVIIKNAIAEHLGKEPQDIKEKDYDLAKGLSLYSKKINDITLLKRCKNLRSLHLTKTGISNLFAIKGLTNLTELWLDDNHISDISALNGLANLTHLYLSSNQISDISSLKGLTKLVLLDLNKTKINDLTPIGGLDKLTHLGVSTTQIDNIKVVSKLTNLRFLGITNTKVSDLEPIKDLINLERLFFSGTQVTNLEPVKGLEKLEVLSFNNTSINNLEPLEELDNLQVVKMRNTPINSLEPIKGLSDLKELRIEGCEKITPEQIDELQEALPDCKIPATEIKDALIFGKEYRLFFNPKVPGLSKTKIMRFGKDGTILEGRNINESSWRIRSGYLEMIDSKGRIHSRFYYEPDRHRFSQEFDPESGTMRKHGIRDQYMVPEE